MKIYEKLRKDDSLIRLSVLTGLGAGIQIFYIAFQVWNFSREGIQDLSSLEPQTPLLIGYFIITIAFSIPASLSFKPKRIVSPLYIQIITGVFILGIISNYLILNANLFSERAIQNALVSTLLIVVTMIVTGFVQTEIVKRVVGLNGILNDLDRKTYRLSTDFQKISSEMRKKPFLNLSDFKIIEFDNNTLVLASKSYVHEKLVLVASEDPKKPLETILATVSYEVKHESITKSENASAIMKSVVMYLINTIKNLEPSIQIVEESLENEISNKASVYALSPTRSKFAGLRGTPRYYIFVTIFIAVVGIATTIAYFVEIFGEELYFGTLVLIALEALFVFVPLVRESSKEKSVIE